MSKSPEHASLFHGFSHGDQFLSNRSRQANGDIGKGFGSSSNHDLGVSSKNLFGSGTNSRIGTDACLGDGMRTNRLRQARVNGGFTGNIGSPDFLDDISADDVIDLIFVEGSLCQETIDSVALEIDGQLVFIQSTGHGKGQTNTRDNHDGVVDDTRCKCACSDLTRSR